MQKEIEATIGEKMTAMELENEELNKEIILQVVRNKLEGIKWQEKKIRNVWNVENYVGESYVDLV